MKPSDDGDIFVGEQGSGGGVMRWIPRLVVLGAVGGFAALSWYAYHTGTQSINEEELMVVEADKTPVKEKPVDPGGMKFPNQDKTIFNTFANSGQVPPKVERVMPAPEEPMPKQMDTSGTQTWINDKLHKRADALPSDKPEQVIGDEKYAPAPAAEPADKSQSGKDAIASYTIDKALSSHTTEEASQAAPVEAPAPKPAVIAAPAAPKPVAKAPEKPAAPVVAAGAAKAQLGAYRSEKEARDAFTLLQKKYSELGGKSPVIVKADLGAKGIYYRLRVGNLSVPDAKSLCGGLSAKGQPCIVALD